MTQDDDEDEDDDGGFFFHHTPGFGQEPPSWYTRPPYHDPFGFEDFFRDFNELFADFGSMIQDVPRFPGVGPPPRSTGGSGSGSLRDFMLKHPDSHLPRDQTSPSQGPSQPRWPSKWQENDGAPVPPGDTKKDKILDSEVSSRGLDSILTPSSYFRSVSVSRVMLPDGSVEERRTVQDSEGNKTVTVTRSDQVISGATGDTSTDGHSAMIPDLSLPDLSDSQTILSRILQGWFTK